MRLPELRKFSHELWQRSETFLSQMTPDIQNVIVALEFSVKPVQNTVHE